MPRSSRHRSHRSHRRGGSPDRSESEGEEVAATGSREEAAAAARVSRDPEPERRRSSSGKEAARSGNGYAENGRKRKERVEEAVVDVVSDRWNSGVCEDHLVDKRSKSEALGPVDSEKPKGSGDEPKRSSRRAVASDERVEEVVSKSDSAKRRSEREKDSRRRESIGYYKDDRDRDREREREKEWERQKDREQEKSIDREREHETDRDQEREHEKQKDREIDKKDYDSNHAKYDDGGSRKSGSKTIRVEEEEAYSYRRDIEVNEIPAKGKYTHSEKQPDKHSRKKDDPEDTDKWAADSRDSDDRKTLSGYNHSNARSSKEQRIDDDKYREKYKDDYGRDKRQQDDKFLDDRVTRDHESERADYKSGKDVRRSLEGHYRKGTVQDGDHSDDYGSRYKETRGRKRPPEENDDQYDLKHHSTRDQRVNLEKSSGSGCLDSLIDKARAARPDPSSSPSKLHARSSPGPSSYHEKDKSWHGTKLTDHKKREVPYDERNIRQRTSSVRERTPATRHRDRDVENSSSERLKQKDDHHHRDIPPEISTLAQYDRTHKKDTHASPKQLSEKSPSSGDQRFSSRISSGRSLDNKGERNSLTKYRDRDGDLSQERSIYQDRTLSRVPFREPTPSGSSLSRGGHFSGASPNHHLPQPARQRTEDPSFLGPHDDDHRPRFNGHQKRNDMNSGHGHGHSWNNPPNWPAPVANGFIPIQHGTPGFHPPVHQFPAPHMFNLRPQMKLNQPGVSYPMHDAHIRPFGWPNPLDESCPPHLWNGRSGMFPGEHYIYGRQEWDQNRAHAGSRGWEMAGDASKGLNEVSDGKLPVAKEPDSTATAVSETTGGEHNSQPQIERKEIKRSTSENFEANDDAKNSVKSLESSPAPLNTSMLSRDGAVFSKSYLSRISMSRDLVDSELYNRCISLLGDFGVTKALQVTKNEFVQNNGNIGRIRNHGTPNLLGSLYLKSNSAIFQRAMALHKNRTGKVFALAKTEGNVDLPEATHDKKMFDCAPKESAVSNVSQHHNVDIMVEGSPSKQEPGDGTGAANPAATESAVMSAPSALSQPAEEMEAVVRQAIAEPEGDTEDVVSPGIEVPADVRDDVVPQVTLEHAADLRDATPADAMEDGAPYHVGKSGDSVEVMPPAVPKSSLGEEASASGSPDGHGIPPSIMHEDADTGMEDGVDKAIGENPGNCGANSSGLAPELDATPNDAGDPEALLVESRVNLSRIPNSPESTH